MNKRIIEIIASEVEGFDGHSFVPEAIIERLESAGFVIAPKEPTEEMCSSGLTEFQRDPDMPRMRDYWRAMIAAASQDK